MFKATITTLPFFRKELMGFAIQSGYNPKKISFISFKIEGNINIYSFLTNIRFEFPIKYISGTVEKM